MCTVLVSLDSLTAVLETVHHTVSCWGAITRLRLYVTALKSDWEDAMSVYAFLRYVDISPPSTA